MSQGRPLRTYMVGDEVRMTVEVVHRMNVVAVYVSFGHESGLDVSEILLADEIAAQYQRLARGEKRSVWKPSASVGPEHQPGLYNLRHISLRTAAGWLIDIPAEAHLRQTVERSFRVVEEPEYRPYFGTVRFES